MRARQGKGATCPGLNAATTTLWTIAGAVVEAVAARVITTARFAASANNHLPEGVW